MEGQTNGTEADTGPLPFIVGGQLETTSYR